jgi:hypothetical protein
MLFTFNNYSVNGGLGDHDDSFDSMEDLKEYLASLYEIDDQVVNQTIVENRSRYNVVSIKRTVDGPEDFQILDRVEGRSIHIDWLPPQENTTEIGRLLITKPTRRRTK